MQNEDIELTDQELERLLDPVIWCETFLKDPTNSKKPFQARTYQADILHHVPILIGYNESDQPIYDNRSKILRMGRRCLTGDMKVLMSSRTYKKIKNIKIGDEIVSYLNGELVNKKVTDWIINGCKVVYKIVLSNDKTITCTDNHPILIKQGKQILWKTLKEINLAVDKVMCIENKDSNDIISLHIKSIKKEGKQETYDISVDETHNFICNDIIVHNTGKCITPDMKVLTSNYTYKDVLSLNIGETIKTIDSDGKIQDRRIIDKMSNGVKPVYRVELTNGMYIDCTINHPILTIRNGEFIWKTIEDGFVDYERIVIHENDTLYSSYIKCIKYLEERETYDISVEVDHNFICNGIVTHNTTVMGADVIYRACTTGGLRVLYLAPFESQCKLFFNILGNMLAETGIKTVKFTSSHNYYIEFPNKSFIKGFVANTSSSSKGNSIRGQEGDLICFPAGTNVNINEDTVCDIKDLEVGTDILGFFNKKYMGSIKELHITENAEVMKLMHDLGEVICTPNHPIYYNGKDIPAKDAKYINIKEDYIYLPFDKELVYARLLGYMFFNMEFQEDYVRIQTNSINIQQIIYDLNYLGESSRNIYKSKDKKVLHSHLLFNYLMDKCKINKYYPGHFSGAKVLAFILKESKEYQKEFLNGLLSFILPKLETNMQKTQILEIFMALDCSNKALRVKYFLNILRKFGIKIKRTYDYNNKTIIIINKENANKLLEFNFPYNKYNRIVRNHCVLFNISDEIDYKVFVRKTKIINGYFTLKINNKEYLKDKATVYNITTDKFAAHRYHANGIIVHNCLDEMDYGMDEIIEQIVMPIYNVNPKCSIIGSSTPSGRRGVFFNWNAKPEIIKGRVFHVPSHQSPNWTKDAENAARSMCTNNTYVHEYDADFGEEETGVFKKQDIDICTIHTDHKTKEEYYNSLKYNNNNLYIMGVDWNKLYGVCIIVLEKDTKTNIYKVFRHEVIEKSKLTQLNGVARIIEINKNICPCNYIFIDYGFGEVQYELLIKASSQPENCLTEEMINGINFSSNIEYFSKIENKDVKKPAKPFMVENFEKIMENRNIILSNLEEGEKNLIDQMSKYNVKSVSGKVPTYTGYDHSLDALMLAALGFRLKYEEVQAEVCTPKSVHMESPAQVAKQIEEQQSINNNFSVPQNRIREAINRRYNIIGKRSTF